MSRTPHRDNSNWHPKLRRLARELGVDGYTAGSLLFTNQDGQEVILEPLANGSALALHAGLGSLDRQDGDDRFDFGALLAANAPAPGGNLMLCAIDAVNDDVVIFQHMGDAGSWSYQDLLWQVRRFCDAASEGPPPPSATSAALPEPGHAQGPGEPIAWHPNEDAFRHVWLELIASRGLRTPGDSEDATTGGVIALDDGGWLRVRNEIALGTVLIEATLGFLTVGQEAEAAVYRGLLEAHLLGDATDGACFCIDREDRALAAWRRLPLKGLDARALAAEIDSLATTAAYHCELFHIARPGVPTDSG